MSELSAYLQTCYDRGRISGELRDKFLALEAENIRLKEANEILKKNLLNCILEMRKAETVNS